MRAPPAECNSALRPSTQAPLLWVVWLPRGRALTLSLFTRRQRRSLSQGHRAGISRL